jgi:hypothetical protein
MPAPNFQCQFHALQEFSRLGIRREHVVTIQIVKQKSQPAKQATDRNAMVAGNQYQAVNNIWRDVGDGFGVGVHSLMASRNIDLKQPIGDLYRLPGSFVTSLDFRLAKARMSVPTLLQVNQVE